jgi:hypothetical protein
MPSLVFSFGFFSSAMVAYWLALAVESTLGGGFGSRLQKLSPQLEFHTHVFLTIPVIFVQSVLVVNPAIAKFSVSDWIALRYFPGTRSIDFAIVPAVYRWAVHARKAAKNSFPMGNRFPPSCRTNDA